MVEGEQPATSRGLEMPSSLALRYFSHCTPSATLFRYAEDMLSVSDERLFDACEGSAALHYR